MNRNTGCFRCRLVVQQIAGSGYVNDPIEIVQLFTQNGIEQRMQT